LNIGDFGDVGSSGSLTLADEDGNNYLIAQVPPTLANGNNLFFGIVDSSASITKIVLTKTTESDGITIDEIYFTPADATLPISNPATKELVSGPLKDIGNGVYEPFHDIDGDGTLDEGAFVVINQNFSQRYEVEIEITNTAGPGALDDILIVDFVPSPFGLDVEREDLDDAALDGFCIDGVCDGVIEDPLCPVLVTGGSIVIEAGGLDPGEICKTVAYLATQKKPSKGKGKAKNKFEPATCVALSSVNLNEVTDTFALNFGVKVFDVVEDVLLFGPSDSIHLKAVDCPPD